MKYLNIAFVLARIALILCVLPFAIGWRTPLFAGWRYVVLTVLLTLPALLIAAEVRTLRRGAPSRSLRIMSAVSLALAAIAFSATATLELSFQYQKRAVLAADAAALEKLGRHIVVGYRGSAALHALIERRAVAGVFVSARNVEGQAPRDIRARIDELQDMRRIQKLPPLLIATDQEGGPVSRLTPPLTRMAPIADVVALHPDPAERLVAIRQYAAHQGRELMDLGINVNFAPVVDLNHGVVNPDDRLSRISARAISPDPAVVTDVAELYCETMRLHGVHCTLKHFPGLGRVFEDTHKVTAELDTPAAELESSDWLPFRRLMSNDATFTMLSHARLTAIDPTHPVSFSSAVVTGLLRETWMHEGVLITDDFSMGAVTLSHEGAAGGAIAALNAGVDLLLVSYDPDQYYPIMYALLGAARDGRLNSNMLNASDARLAKAVLPARSTTAKASAAVGEVGHNP